MGYKIWAAKVFLPKKNDFSDLILNVNIIDKISVFDKITYYEQEETSTRPGKKHCLVNKFYNLKKPFSNEQKCLHTFSDRETPFKGVQSTQGISVKIPHFQICI